MMWATTTIQLSSSSGNQWMARQARDLYVRQARGMNYVARSAFKLIEIDDKYGIFHAASTTPLPSAEAARSPFTSTSPLKKEKPSAVLDLGCSPGSWCQAARERCGDHCHIVALDLLPVRAEVVNASFIQGDFMDVKVQHTVRLRLHDTGLTGFDVVLSDMCPNRRGGMSDRQRQATLQLEALRFSIPLLCTGGHFVAKVLGSSTSQEELRAELNRWFLRVSVFKPLSSRLQSDEEFLIGRGKLAAPRPVSLGGNGGRSRFGLDDWPGFARRGRGRLE